MSNLIKDYIFARREKDSYVKVVCYYTSSYLFAFSALNQVYCFYVP